MPRSMNTPMLKSGIIWRREEEVAVAVVAEGAAAEDPPRPGRRAQVRPDRPDHLGRQDHLDHQARLVHLGHQVHPAQVPREVQQAGDLAIQGQPGISPPTS